MFEERVQDYSFQIDPSDPNNARTKFIRMIPRGSRVLEVGCANGSLAGYLTQHLGCEVVGIELNPEAAREAEFHCSHIIVGDVERGALDRAEGIFDVITFGDVLEHLVLPGAVLSRCRSLLSDEGFLLLSIPNVAHYMLRFRLLLGQFDYEQYGLLDRTHLRFFTLRTARQMLAESGYRISEFDIVYAVHGGRIIRRCGPLERFLKRHLTGLIGNQFIFKATKTAGTNGGLGESVACPDTRQWVNP